MWMLFHIAARNLTRGWRRSLAVIGSIVIWLAGCLVLVGWSRGFAFQMAENAVRSDLATIAVQARGYQANPDPTRTLPAPPGDVLSLADGRAGVWAAPRLRAEDRDMPEEPGIEGVTSGYMQRGLHQFPRQGDRMPWRNTQCYVEDKKLVREAPVDDGVMEFSSG